MSESVKTMFTDISPTYDKLNHFLSFNIDKIWRKKAVSLINKKSTDSFMVLDLCAGTYDLSIECLKQFKNCQIQALDFSKGMLDAGMKKIEPYYKRGVITPVVGDALNMPIKDHSIDVILCGYGVRNFDDTKKGLSEIKRVLKPGGQVIILEFFKPNKMAGKFFHQTYAHYFIPIFGKLISGNNGAYHYLKESIKGFLTTNSFNVLLKETGFNNIVIKDFFIGISSVVSAISNLQTNSKQADNHATLHTKQS